MNRLLLILAIAFLIILILLYNQNQKLTHKIAQLKQDIEVSNLYIEKLNREITRSGIDKINKEEYLLNLLDDYLKTVSEKDQNNDSITLDEEVKKNLRNLNKTDNFFPDEIPIRGEYKLSQRFKDKHQGLDFAAPLGTEVVSAAGGIVISTYEDKYFGNVIEIDHLNGYTTRYAHLAKILVKKDLLINKSDLIGLVGDTGNSTAPHLHFEIKLNGTHLNPEKYLKLDKQG